MSNIIDSIRLSGVTYTIQGTGGGGVPESAFTAYTAATDARIAEDEEVTAAALNELNEAISGVSGNNVVELTQAQYDALVTGGTVDPTAFYIITDATAGDLTQYWTSAQTQSAITAAVSGKASQSDLETVSGQVANKQDTLVSGTNIKTINNESILGSGNINIQGGGVDVVQTTGTSTTDVMSQNAVTTQLNGKGDAIGLDLVGSPKKKVTFRLKSGGVNGSTISSRDLPLGRGLVYGEEGFTTLSTSGLVETSAITTSITSSSTDAQVPSAKAVYDAIQQGGGGGGTVDQTIISGSTNAVAGGAVYDKFDEVEQVTAAALNNINDRLSEDEEVTAAALNNLSDNFGGLKLMKLTQNEYNALSPNYDSNTLYVIVN